MLEVYICEDDKHQLTQITKFVNDIIAIEELDMELSISTSSPEEILAKTAAASHTGFYLLDIDLKSDMNGLVLAQKIRTYDPRGFIVFITTHSEMSYMTFLYKCEALDFIIKDDFDEYKRRIHSCLIDAYNKHNHSGHGNDKKFTLKLEGRQINIACNEILYFETSDNIHKVKLHTSNRLLEFNEQLKTILPNLDDRFCRCHRSYIINRDHIKEIDFKAKTAIMSNGDTCLISARMMKTLIKDN